MKTLHLLRLLVLLLAVGCATLGARAADAPGVAPDVAQDPALEKRVNEIGLELRCLVCQNQTIADSHAGLAIDLKNQIREQLQAGKTDRQILDFMVERYGDFVLYKPPVKATTILLWVGPFALMAIGLGVAALIVRRRGQAAADAPQLTEEQRRKAARLLADEPETRS